MRDMLAVKLACRAQEVRCPSCWQEQWRYVMWYHLGSVQHICTGEPCSCDVLPHVRASLTAWLYGSGHCFCGLIGTTACFVHWCVGNTLQIHRGLVFKPLRGPMFSLFHSKGRGLQRRQARFNFALFHGGCCLFVELDFLSNDSTLEKPVFWFVGGFFLEPTLKEF